MWEHVYILPRKSNKTEKQKVSDAKFCTRIYLIYKKT